MARCDLCGAQCDAHRLCQLLDSYAMPDIRDICPECKKWADGVKANLLRAIPEHMKQAIRARKEVPPRARSRYSRLMFWKGATNG